MVLGEDDSLPSPVTFLLCCLSFSRAGPPLTFEFLSIWTGSEVTPKVGRSWPCRAPWCPAEGAAWSCCVGASPKAAVLQPSAQPQPFCCRPARQAWHSRRRAGTKLMLLLGFEGAEPLLGGGRHLCFYLARLFPSAREPACFPCFVFG